MLTLVRLDSAKFASIQLMLDLLVLLAGLSTPSYTLFHHWLWARVEFRGVSRCGTHE